MIAVLVWSTLDQARPAESIVVLGAAQYDGRPSPVLRARLDHAIELWNRHLAHVVILTGGRGFGDTTSEAAVGRGYVKRRGIQTRHPSRERGANYASIGSWRLTNAKPAPE